MKNFLTLDCRLKKVNAVGVLLMIIAVVLGTHNAQAQEMESPMAMAQTVAMDVSTDPDNPEDIADFIYYGSSTTTLQDGNIVPVSLYRDPNSDRIVVTFDEATDYTDPNSDYNTPVGLDYTENTSNWDYTYPSFFTRPEYQNASGEGYVIGISVNATNINATNPTDSGVSRIVIEYPNGRVNRIAFDNTALGTGDRTDDTGVYLGTLNANEWIDLQGNPGKTVSFGDEDGDGDVDGNDAAAAILSTTGLTVNGLKQGPGFSGSTHPDQFNNTWAENNIAIPLATTQTNGAVVYATVQDHTGTAISQTLRVRAVADYSAMATQEVATTATRYAIYPNPTVAVLYIDQGKDLSTVDIVDATGKKVRHLDLSSNQSLSPVEINTIDLVEGAYFLVIKDNKGYQETHTFIKK